MIALVGSPRAKSTSEMLARRLADGVQKHGWQVDVQRITVAMRKPERWAALEAQVRAADAVALVFPLYVDALPAETTQALERLAAVYQTQPPEQAQRWLAVVNCGFFEAKQNDIALAICREFTREAGVQWSGGLAIGGGGMFSGQPLEHYGNMTRHLVRAFDLTIDALAAETDLPAEALQLVRQPLFPAWMYFLMANLGMYKAAYDHHVLTRINAQPYARKTE